MMMKKYTILTLLVWLCNVLTGESQTVYWIVKPATYNEITYVAPNTYKVVKNGKIGLINAVGEVLAEPVNDEMTGFYDNKALLLTSDGSGSKISGCLTAGGTYYKFSNDYYTLNGQAFYSNGLISVGNKDSKLGYVDEKGNPVLGFDERFDKIKPFVEGYAAVFLKKKYSLINKQGQAVRFAFDGVAELYGGTNVCNGLAYVWDTNGKFYTYNVERGGLCKKVKAPANISSIDFLYRFSSISGLGKQPAFTTQNAPADSDPDFPTVTNGDNSKGYSYAGKTIVPQQFSDAGPFLSGAAIVAKGGRYGLLGFMAEEGFAANTTEPVIRVRDNQTASCNIMLQVPAVWKSKNIEVKVSDDEGNLLFSGTGKEPIAIESKHTTDETVAYHMQVSGVGLTLWECTINQKYEIIHICKTCNKEISKCAYHGKHPKANNDGEKKEKKNTNIIEKDKFVY